ncbi:Chitinase 4 [Rhodosporidiobolus nylandii]
MSSIPRPNGKVNVGYFTNWGIYARGYKPEHVPVDDLTHILYSFAEVKEDGEVKLTDAWSDEQIHYANDSWNDVGTNLYGNLKQLYLLKQRARHLKIMLSIGGWTYSENGRFARPISTPAGKAKFVGTAVKLVEDYGLDGLDVDFEYPQNDKEAQDYIELLKGLREGLDALQQKLGVNGEHGFELSIAAPCGPDNIAKLRIREMDQYLSFWNLMAYDYSGSWDQIANHQANLFSPNPGSLSTDRAIRMFTDPQKGGVAVDKLVLGIPLYGRSFLSTDGPGTPFSGVGQGSWEAGSYDYKALPLPGSAKSFDPHLVAASSFNPSTREFISYDTAQSAAAKAEFICVNGLRGGMYWELSGDKKPEEGGIVRVVADRLKREGMDKRPNWLQYPTSKWDNLRRGMK